MRLLSVPIRSINLADQGPLALPEGFVVLHAPDQPHGQAILAQLTTALERDLALSTDQARDCVIRALDPGMAVQADEDIRALHWRELWRPFIHLLGGSARIDTLLERRRSLKLQLAELENDPVNEEPRREPSAAHTALQRRLTALQAQLDGDRHALRLIESEIRRDLSGLSDVPDAAKVVTRLGQVQAQIKGEYLSLVDQRSEVQTKRQALGNIARKLRKENENKIRLGGIFVLLGLIGAGAAKPELRPMGGVVVLLGAVLIYIASKALRAKETPREAQLNRQLEEIERKMQDVESRLKEAERQVKQFCAKVGCTSPGQVLELNRRYEQRREERGLLVQGITAGEREVGELIEQVAQQKEATDQTRAASTWPAQPGAAVATLPAQRSALEVELTTVDRELASEGSGWGAPSEETLIAAADSILQMLGGADSQWRFAAFKPDQCLLQRAGESVPRALIELDLYRQVLLYLVARAAICTSVGANGEKLPLLVDDPLRFWDDDALPNGLALMGALARAGHQVLFITTRTSLLAAWRQAARVQGRVLTVIELGHGPMQVEASL